MSMSDINARKAAFDAAFLLSALPAGLPTIYCNVLHSSEVSFLYDGMEITAVITFESMETGNTTAWLAYIEYMADGVTVFADDYLSEAEYESYLNEMAGMQGDMKGEDFVPSPLFQQLVGSMLTRFKALRNQ